MSLVAAVAHASQPLPSSPLPTHRLTAAVPREGARAALPAARPQLVLPAALLLRRAGACGRGGMKGPQSNDSFSSCRTVPGEGPGHGAAHPARPRARVALVVLRQADRLPQRGAAGSRSRRWLPGLPPHGLPSPCCLLLLLLQVEELLEMAGPAHVRPVLPLLMRTLARCVGSTHFQAREGRGGGCCCGCLHATRPSPAASVPLPLQVAERALFLWNSESLINGGRIGGEKKRVGAPHPPAPAAGGVLSKEFGADALPVLYAPLLANSAGHWNTTVETLAQVRGRWRMGRGKERENASPPLSRAELGGRSLLASPPPHCSPPLPLQNVLKHYHDGDPDLYERCAAEAQASDRGGGGEEGGTEGATTRRRAISNGRGCCYCCCCC